MSLYRIDRTFTDYIHQELAIPIVYEPLNWYEVPMRQDFAKSIDMMDGVDYVFKFEDQYFSVQERFRTVKYQKYNDFTIRYRRDENHHTDRVKSEFYKLKAQYFLYAICNGQKDKPDSNTHFVKWALIYLPGIYSRIDEQLIDLVSTKRMTCWIENNRLKCPINYNHDGSSSFIPLDIPLLKELWGNEVIKYSFGY